MKISFRKFVKIGNAFLVKHSADILTAATAAGVVITAIETRKATLHAEEYLRVNGYYDTANEETKKVLRYESYKNYIFPAVIGFATIGTAVGANYINHKQIAGLAAACTVAETALSEHKDKIRDLMGDRALGKIEDDINLDHAAKAFSAGDEVLTTNRGDILCCEGFLTGRMFRASTDWVKRCVNEYNERINTDTYCSWGEFLEILWQDLPAQNVPKKAYDIGYNIHQNGLLRIRITSDIDPKTGEPYMVFMPINEPIANYMEIF